MTRLDKPLKRELRVKKDAYVLLVDPDGFKLTKKGRRKGIEMSWKDLLSGDAAMAVALRASLGTAKMPPRTPSRRPTTH